MTIRRLHHLVGRRTFWATLIIALAVAALSGAVTTSSNAASAASAAVSPYAGRVGVNGHLVWIGPDDIAKQYSRARAGGVEWVREEFRWDFAEPKQGQWNFSRGDNLFTGASKAGVNVLLLLDYGATWANWTDAQFANYAATLAGRYGVNGTFWQQHPELIPRPVTRMEIWNEPYMPQPYLTPARYAKLVRATSQAVRALGKNIRLAANVDTGNYAENKQDYFDQLIAADPKLHETVDAWSLHPYSQECGPYATDATCPQLGQRWRFDRVTLFRDLAALKGVSRPLWLTEFGWSTYGGGVSEATQASRTRDAVKRALVDWGTFVEMVFVYQWDRDSGNGKEANYGLRRADDSSKPAWTELASLIQQASGGAGTPPPPPPPTTPPPGGTQPSPPPAATPTPPPAAPAPPPATAPKASTAPKSSPPRRGTAHRSTASLKVPVPGRMPQWFWPWARWKLGHAEFSGARAGSPATRPRNAPARIPAWAWRRLSHSWSA